MAVRIVFVEPVGKLASAEPEFGERVPFSGPFFLVGFLSHGLVRAYPQPHFDLDLHWSPTFWRDLQPFPQVVVDGLGLVVAQIGTTWSW